MGTTSGMRWGRWGIASAAAVTVGLSGCGTEPVDSSVIVTSGTTEQVSVFDAQQGDTRANALKTLGSVSPETPYRTTVTAEASKGLFGSGTPKNVNFGLALPARHDDGYYAVNLQPHDGSQQVQAAFVTWAAGAGSSAAPNSVPPLTLDVSASASDNGWRLTMMLPPS